MNNKEQALTTLQDAYFTLVGNELENKHKELAEAITNAIKALGGNVPKCPEMSSFKMTEAQAIARIHNETFSFNMQGDNWTDDEFDSFFEIPFIALQAIVEVKSTCKEDTEAKLGVVRLQYSDYSLDECEKITLKILEHELTGVVGKWGKDEAEARGKQENC